MRLTNFYGWCWWNVLYFERAWFARQSDVDRLITVFLRAFITQKKTSAGGVWDSPTWSCRSNSFVRAPSRRLQRPSRCRICSAHQPERIDAERDKRGVRFFFLDFGRYTPEFFLGLGICRAWTIVKRQHCQICVISKLASKFGPDDAFFIAASERLPYRSYYSFVSFPLG